MSHEATNWAFKQRGLKPATKIVLLALADRHNPDFGCFPSKSTLAKDCELSERSVYDQLKILEKMGLVYIEPNKELVRGQYVSNRYILAFERDFPPQNLPSAKSADGKVQQKPSANFARGRRQILPTNPVTEPCNKTSKASSSSAHNDDTLFEKVLAAVGLTNGKLPTHWMPPASIIHVQRWQTELGLSQNQIIDCARQTRAQHDSPPNGPKALDGAMQRFAMALAATRLAAQPRPSTSAAPQRLYDLKAFGVDE